MKKYSFGVLNISHIHAAIIFRVHQLQYFLHQYQFNSGALLTYLFTHHIVKDEGRRTAHSNVKTLVIISNLRVQVYVCVGINSNHVDVIFHQNVVIILKIVIDSKYRRI